MRPAAPRRLEITAARALGALAVLAAGCYEFPPVIPKDLVGSPAAEGWPPLAVYHPDSFHARNRWFHRQWSGRSLEGRIVRAHADEPLGLLSSPSRVDEAEILALLRSLDAEPVRELGAAGERARICDALFRGDLLREAARIRAEWPAGGLRDEILKLLEAVGARGPALTAGDERERALVPPPLRGGPWSEASMPSSAGLLPSPADPRPTRVFRTAAPNSSSAIVRGFASECWLIERSGDGESRRVYRFDRAEWLHGREPWRLVPGEAEIVIRSPLDPLQALRGPAAQLCAGCHCGR